MRTRTGTRELEPASRPLSPPPTNATSNTYGVVAGASDAAFAISIGSGFWSHGATGSWHFHFHLSYSTAMLLGITHKNKKMNLWIN